MLPLYSDQPKTLQPRYLPLNIFPLKCCQQLSVSKEEGEKKQKQKYARSDPQVSPQQRSL